MRQDQYDSKMFPAVLMGTAGTAGDPVISSTGSALTVKSQAGGTHLCGKEFLGLLVNSASAGGYAAVQYNGIVQLPKSATANKIEVGDRLHIGTSSATASLVGTVVIGTHIGICAKQSATTNPNVSVILTPAFLRL